MHLVLNPPEPNATTTQKPKATATKSTQKKRLSYKLQRELEQLPAQIEALEQQVSTLQEQTAAPEFFNSRLQKPNPVLKDWRILKPS